MGEMRITLVRSTIGATKKQRATVAGLGLRRVNQRVVKPSNAALKGMVAKIHHLVRVEESG
ncbi:50S ribosomal protein L30 [Thermodesulfitimonas sp.]